MPDIRDTLNALDERDARLYAQVRTTIRRSYISAHTEVVGTALWDESDDRFLDLIDIKVATLFDRGGRFNSMAEGAKVPDAKTAEVIEKTITTEDDKVREFIHPTQQLLAQIAAEGDKPHDNVKGNGWPAPK